MNLLFFLDRYPGCGGIERLTTVLANALSRRGHAIHILSRFGQELELLKDLDPEVVTHMLPDSDWLAPTNRNALRGLCTEHRIEIVLNQESYSGAIDLLRTLDRPDIGIITAEHNSPDALSRQLSAYLAGEPITGSPRSWIKRAARPLLMLRSRANERREHGKYLDSSDRLVLLSKRFVPVLEQVSGRRNLKNVTWIHNALENPAPPMAEAATREKQVLYMGRLIREQKRVDRLLRIWQIVESLRQDWELVLVGDGPDRKPLEALAGELGLKRVRFDGFRSDVAQCYAKASLLVLTSEVEGLAMVLPEAMAHGVVPILYDSFAAAADAVEDGVSGVLVRPFDEQAFVRELMALMDDEPRLASMRARGRVKANDFSLEGILKSWESLFAQVHEERQGRVGK